jgi:hypothetical protein
VRERNAIGREKAGTWEDTKEGRERGLRERKERMVLEARRWVDLVVVWASGTLMIIRRLMEKQSRSGI